MTRVAYDVETPYTSSKSVSVESAKC